jgi:hypothetical protein
MKQESKKKKKNGSKNTVKEIKQYQKKWLKRVQRMDTKRVSKQTLQYTTTGRRKHKKTEEKMEGPNSISRSRNRKHT